MIALCFPSILQLLEIRAYRKGCLSFAVKGEGIEKGRGIPLPFSVLLVPFVTVQKERLFYSSWKRSRFVPASRSRGDGMILLPGAAKVPKSALYGSHSDPWGQSRIPGFAMAFILYKLFFCTGLHDYSAFAGPAMSCCDYPLHTKSLQTLFVSVSDRR